MAVILFGTFLVLLLLSVPISYSLGIASLAAMLTQGSMPTTIIAQRMFTGLDSFPLLAVPFFILAGAFMETGGISARLVRLASVLVGHIRGGLGMVVIVSTMFFSGISGSCAADAAAIGSIMIPSMSRRGYPRALAGAIVAAAGGMGILIPPSITMILIGLTANVSIGYLFIAGFLPGALMGLSIMLLVYLLAGRHGLPRETRSSCGEMVTAAIDAVPPLMMPVIILGGILSGVFTATEAAVVAVIYGAILSLVVYRELHLRDVPAILVSSAKLTGIVMLLVGVSSTFAWILASQYIPQMIAEGMLSMSSEPWLFLLMVNLLFLFVGTIMDAPPAIIMLVPIIYPIARKLGIDDIHFGTVLVANLGIGLVTPPVGVVLYVAASIGKTSIEELSKPLLPFFGTMILALLVITYLPDVTLFVPRLLGYAH